MHPRQIICAGNEGKTGILSYGIAKYFSELLKLSGDSGGRQIFKYHQKEVRIVEAEREELKDIDRQKDLECLRKEVGV